MAGNHIRSYTLGTGSTTNLMIEYLLFMFVDSKFNIASLNTAQGRNNKSKRHKNSFFNLISQRYVT